MLEKLKPGIVARSTVSANSLRHSAHVARSKESPPSKCNTGWVLRPRFREQTASRGFTAVYGPLTKNKCKKRGIRKQHPWLWLSRFDAYAAAREAVGRAGESGVSILCIAPAIDPGGDSPDSYDAGLLFDHSFGSKKIPDVSVVIKFRQNRQGPFCAHNTCISFERTLCNSPARTFVGVSAAPT